MKRVEVQWRDPCGDAHDWTDAAVAIAAATPARFLHRTMGYVLVDDEEMLVLASSRSEDGQVVADTLQIPRGAIVKIDPLRPG